MRRPNAAGLEPAVLLLGVAEQPQRPAAEPPAARAACRRSRRCRRPRYALRTGCVASPSTTSCSTREPANVATTARAAADSSCRPAAKSSSIGRPAARPNVARISAASSTWRGARNGAGSSGRAHVQPPPGRPLTVRPGAGSRSAASRRSARFASPEVGAAHAERLRLRLGSSIAVARSSASSRFSISFVMRQPEARAAGELARASAGRAAAPRAPRSGTTCGRG